VESWGSRGGESGREGKVRKGIEQTDGGREGGVAKEEKWKREDNRAGSMVRVRT